jgi:PAS domain S-box-containing protein
MTGLTTQEALGQGWIEALHPDDHNLIFAEWYEAAQTAREFNLEYRFITPQGKIVWVDGKAVPLYGETGEISGYLGTVTDISDRKKVETALQTSGEMFSTLVKNAPFGIYLIDAEFRLQQINQGSEAVFSSIDPLIGRDFAEILRIIWQEPFATEAINRFHHTLATGESYYSPTIIEPRANIEEIQAYDWQIHQIVLPDGSHGVVCYFYDLSKIKQAELKIREQAALLDVATDAIMVRGLDDKIPMAEY